jgi:hypothetical protein
MALRSRFGLRTRVPTTTSTKGQTKQLSYKGGVDSEADNDDVPAGTLIYATDARQVKRGRYKTRKGASRYSVPVDEAVTASQTSTTGASTVTVNGNVSVAEKLTTASTGGLTMAEVRVRTTATSSGALLVEFYSDNSGNPGTLLGTSSIAASAISSSFAYLPAYFMAAPDNTSGAVIWMVIRGQSSDTGDYEISTTTTSTNTKTSVDLTTWAAQTYSLNVKASVTPTNEVKGVYRAYRFNGQKITLFVAGSTLYSVDDTTGATTAVYASLDASATAYRFDMAQDCVYFVDDGLSKPWKLDLPTMAVTSVTTAPELAQLAIEHKGLMFYGNAVDKNQAYFSNFGVYDTFTSTDFLTIPAPKSAHSHVAYAKLNGALYAFAKRNKFVVYGDSNANWSIDEATDQRGTFTQESVTWTDNFIYHADEEGLHEFNGTDSRNLAKNFLSEYQEIPDKSSIILEVYDNRLYCFYTPAGAQQNSECFVYNLLLDVYEGKDLNTYIGRAFGRLAQDNIFIQASNRVAALYYGEPDSNDYDNLGGQLNFEVRTAYDHFGTPAQLKRAPKWKPTFNSVAGTYDVQVGYATDLINEATYQDVSLSRTTPRYNTGLLFNTGIRFATTGGVISPNLFVQGEFKRLQRRYKHHAAHEPVEVDGEMLMIETQGSA